MKRPKSNSPSSTDSDTSVLEKPASDPFAESPVQKRAAPKRQKKHRGDNLELQYLKLEYEQLEREYEDLLKENEKLNKKNDDLRSKVSILRWQARVSEEAGDTTLVEESPKLRDITKAIEEFDMEWKRAKRVLDRNATKSRE